MIENCHNSVVPGWSKAVRSRDGAPLRNQRLGTKYAMVLSRCRKFRTLRKNVTLALEVTDLVPMVTGAHNLTSEQVRCAISRVYNFGVVPEMMICI